MKKYLFLSIIVTSIIVACSHNSIGTKEPVIPKRDATLTAIPISAVVSQLDSATANDANAIFSGKTLYQARCTRCHNLKNVGDFTAQRWDGILIAMANRARLNEAETNEVAAYIKANAKK